MVPLSATMDNYADSTKTAEADVDREAALDQLLDSLDDIAPVPRLTVDEEGESSEEEQPPVAPFLPAPISFPVVKSSVAPPMSRRTSVSQPQAPTSPPKLPSYVPAVLNPAVVVQPVQLPAFLFTATAPVAKAMGKAPSAPSDDVFAVKPNFFRRMSTVGHGNPSLGGSGPLSSMTNAVTTSKSNAESDAQSTPPPAMSPLPPLPSMKPM
jgi:hypothetical protein